MKSSFLALIFRQKHIKRWGLMRSSEPEDLQQHAAETAYVAHILALIKNNIYGGNVNPERVATLALYHDVPEIFTGDLPTPVKYFSPEMRKSYAEIEKTAVDNLISKLPEDLKGDIAPYLSESGTEEEIKLVKTADKLCAYIKCISEEYNGNPEFQQAKAATERSLEKLASPELDYFKEHFLAAFSSPLDDM